MGVNTKGNIMEAEIIGALHLEPMSRTALKAEFADRDKGDFGLALLNLLDEKHVTTINGKLTVTDEGKKEYGLK